MDLENHGGKLSGASSCIDVKGCWRRFGMCFTITREVDTLLPFTRSLTHTTSYWYRYGLYWSSMT